MVIRKAAGLWVVVLLTVGPACGGSEVKGPTDAGGDSGAYSGGAYDAVAMADGDAGSPAADTTTGIPGDTLDTMASTPDGADVATAPPDAAPADTSTPAEPAYEVSVASTHQLDPWLEVHHLVVDHAALRDNATIDKTAQTDPRIIGAFDGDDRPGPGHFLLHVSKACGGKVLPGRTVLLVPGAGSDAQRSFVEASLLFEGMAPALDAAGYCVLAITFAHPFGDNRNQAVVVAAALEQGRIMTGDDRLQVVAHSKGGIVAVTYASGLLAAEGVAFAEDIGRLFLLGTPLRGMDFPFRHPNFNYPADLYALPMPGSWDQILEWGAWKDITEESIYGPAFLGPAQLLAPLDEEYPLSQLEQDWYTTWFGGTGLISHSLGIAEAITMSGSYMEALRTKTLPDTVETFLVAGANPLVNGVAWETAGPSDGVVFVSSATDETVSAGTVESETFAALNHWDLVYAPQVRGWIVDRLP